MRRWDSDSRRRAGRVVGAEVPASLVMTEGVVAKLGNLSSGGHLMSRARKEMDERPDPELEAHLREAGRELIEEAAEDEHLTELLRRRRLDLSERAREFVHRGDRIRAETGAHTFSGQVTYAGADFATVDRGEDTVEVALESAVWAVERSDSPGHEQTGEPLTFRARLSELASTSEPVRLIVGDGRAILGSIAVVATDHVEVVQDLNTIVVPIRLISAVVRSNARF